MSVGIKRKFLAIRRAKMQVKKVVLVCVLGVLTAGYVISCASVTAGINSDISFREEKGISPGFTGQVSIDQEYINWVMGFGIGEDGATEVGLYGKYPFEISERVTMFPLLGTGMQNVASREEFGYFLRGGIGVDYDIISKLFLRSELLYEYVFGLPESRNPSGLVCKLSIGWRFSEKGFTKKIPPPAPAVNPPAPSKSPAVKPPASGTNSPPVDTRFPDAGGQNSGLDSRMLSLKYEKISDGIYRTVLYKPFDDVKADKITADKNCIFVSQAYVDEYKYAELQLATLQSQKNSTRGENERDFFVFIHNDQTYIPRKDTTVYVAWIIDDVSEKLAAAKAAGDNAAWLLLTVSSGLNGLVGNIGSKELETTWSMPVTLAMAASESEVLEKVRARVRK
jgi:hypothetical protein